jgi:nucleotide-binding universal stress UspA family protein
MTPPPDDSLDHEKKGLRSLHVCISVTALLERTGLHAKVTCQAIHGKNAKHMLVDCIDYLEPNLVIVGRRGETSSKGSLMGSVSHYLVQKSSVPV